MNNANNDANSFKTTFDKVYSGAKETATKFKTRVTKAFGHSWHVPPIGKAKALSEQTDLAVTELPKIGEPEEKKIKGKTQEKLPRKLLGSLRKAGNCVNGLKYLSLKGLSQEDVQLPSIPNLQELLNSSPDRPQSKPEVQKAVKDFIKLLEKKDTRDKALKMFRDGNRTNISKNLVANAPADKIIALISSLIDQEIEDAKGPNKDIDPKQNNTLLRTDSSATALITQFVHSKISNQDKKTDFKKALTDIVTSKQERDPKEIENVIAKNKQLPPDAPAGTRGQISPQNQVAIKADCLKVLDNLLVATRANITEEVRKTYRSMRDKIGGEAGNNFAVANFFLRVASPKMIELSGGDKDQIRFINTLQKFSNVLTEKENKRIPAMVSSLNRSLPDFAFLAEDKDFAKEVFSKLEEFASILTPLTLKELIEEQKTDDKWDFESVYDNKPLYRQLHQFAEKQYAHENLDFCQRVLEVSNLEAASDMFSIKAQYQTLYSSLEGLNASGKPTQSAKEKIKQVLSKETISQDDIDSLKANFRVIQKELVGGNMWLGLLRDFTGPYVPGLQIKNYQTI